MSEALSEPVALRRRRRRRELAASRRRVLLRRSLLTTPFLVLAAIVAGFNRLPLPVGPEYDLQIVPEAAVLRQWLPYPQLTLGAPFTDLTDRMRTLSSQPKLRAGFLFYDRTTGGFTGLRAEEPFSAASVIKLPVFIEFLRQVDDGRVRLDEILVLQASQKGGGSGWLQYRPTGSRYRANLVAELMIIRSDNTATNMLIDRLGGAAYLNAQFERWGLQATVLREPLPDLGGQNTTSAADLALLADQLERGQLLSPASRTLAYTILERTRVRTLLPPGLGPGARIFHKTGDIGRMVGDAGIIAMPGGRRYIAAALVERPHNDRRANQLIARLSQQFYHYLGTGQLLGATTPPPARPIFRAPIRRRERQ